MKTAHVRTQKKTAGFTIIELIVVVIVIGILAGVAIVGYGSWKQRTVENQLKSDLQGAKTAMESARNFGSGYPSTIPSTFSPSDGVSLTLTWVYGDEYCIQASSTLAMTVFFAKNNGEPQEGVCPNKPGPQVPSEQIAKLLASDGVAGDNFGYSVDIDGDTALVGAYGDDDSGSASGAAYIFVRSGDDWSQQAKLVPSDSNTDDFFGFSVALSGDTAVVGAYHDDDKGDNSGSAYVFTRSGSAWAQQAKLIASDGASIDYFGYSVAVDADTVLVGSYSDDDKGLQSGSAYVFTRSGSAWTQQAKLTASDGANSDYFGWAVALSGSSALIGAPYDDDSGSNAGSAYVFTRSGSAWTQQVKLTASDAAGSDFFGISIAIHDATAIVGAYGDDDSGSASGSAYIFTLSGSAWTQQVKLTASDAAAGDYFGYSVAVDDNTVVAGAMYDDDSGTSSGSAYVFTRSGSAWTQQAKLTASDAVAGDNFGHSIGLSGGTAIFGAHNSDDTGISSGSAYVFAP